jgi:hypothetical protein
MQPCEAPSTFGGVDQHMKDTPGSADGEDMMVGETADARMEGTPCSLGSPFRSAYMVGSSLRDEWIRWHTSRTVILGSATLVTLEICRDVQSYSKVLWSDLCLNGCGYRWSMC